MIETAYTAPSAFGRLQQRSLIVGAVGTVLLVIGFFINPTQGFQASLIGFLFWLGISVGSLALLMLQHLTGGGWGLVIRRTLEAATRVLPYTALMFLVVLVGAYRGSIYPWTDQALMAESEALAIKAHGFLNLRFFTVRALVYFAIWILLAFFLNQWSAAQDRKDDRRLARNMRVLSGPGLVLFVFTVTFASIDWVMSLDPVWSSTIFGLLFVAAWSLSALAFAIAMLAVQAAHEPMSKVVAPLHFHDLGKLLLALVMLWAYFAFSQFLIIWSGNLPEEIQWYLPRTKGGWGTVALVVVILHFALPFLFLLSRSLKRDPHKLVLVAGLILVMRFIDLLWVIKPNPTFSGAKFRISWMDPIALIGFGGVWFFLFLRELRQWPVMPINDPQMPSVLEQARDADHHGADFIEESAA